MSVNGVVFANCRTCSNGECVPDDASCTHAGGGCGSDADCGGGGGGCSWEQVNCPAGWTRSGEAIGVACGKCAPGTAQATTGCCGKGKVDEDGVWYCGNPQVTTYSCVPSCDPNDWGGWTPASWCGVVTQSRTNACGTTDTQTSTCSECGARLSAWSTCDANHKRTRTCAEDCGTDNCTAAAAAGLLSEDCLGVVRGTLFNASDYGSCPAFNPATGYLVGLPAGAGAPSRTFGFSGTWPSLSAAVTDASGNYSMSVYAPATYLYDFSPLSDIYVTGGGPKLTCFAPTAVVPGNPVACTTQPCTLVYGMSFGFWRIYGGWWQTVGGNVYAGAGIKSEIPSSLLTEMSLILPDATMGDQRGFLSYGIPKAADMLGTNPNAKVSSTLWEKESKYGGPQYDWSYYNSRFNLFTTTAWGDGEVVNYVDSGVGYQIFKSAESITSFDFNPTGTQKAIFHVNGDVQVTGDIVVPSGAFLAIIAKGTITFDPSVTRADGWYVASNISVPCEDIGSDGCDKTDSQFLGNGTFVGWNGFALGRTKEVTNNTAPSEKFTYRQDLYLNAPKPLKIYTKYYKPFVP